MLRGFGVPVTGIMHTMNIFCKVHTIGGHYKTWTLDSGLDHGLDSGLNNGLNTCTKFLIVRGQKLLSGKVMMVLVL